MKRLIIISGLALALMNLTYARDGMQDSKNMRQAIAECKAKPSAEEQNQCLEALKGEANIVPSTPTMPASPTDIRDSQ